MLLKRTRRLTVVKVLALRPQKRLRRPGTLLDWRLRIGTALLHRSHPSSRWLLSEFLCPSTGCWKFHSCLSRYCLSSPQLYQADFKRVPVLFICMHRCIRHHQEHKMSHKLSRRLWTIFPILASFPAPLVWLDLLGLTEDASHRHSSFPSLCFRTSVYNSRLHLS